MAVWQGKEKKGQSVIAGQVKALQAQGVNETFGCRG